MSKNLIKLRFMKSLWWISEVLVVHGRKDLWNRKFEPAVDKCCLNCFYWTYKLSDFKNKVKEKLIEQ